MPTPSRSRLDDFLHEHRIRPAEILSRVSITRSALDAMRYGRTPGSRQSMAAVRAACQSILGRNVGIEELFDFDAPSSASASAVTADPPAA